jgi:hypothetical protein
MDASTPDGKIRYRTRYGEPMRIARVEDGWREGESVAVVKFTARGMSVVDGGVGGTGEKTGGLEVDYEQLQKDEALFLDPAGAAAGMGAEKVTGLRWEVVHGNRASAASEEGGKPGGVRASLSSRLPTDLQARQNQKNALTGLRLVDDQDRLYASYEHAIGLPDLHSPKPQVWGTVSIRSRAVLVPGGVDRAFVGLIALLECYVKVFGQQAKGERKYGNFSGAVGCSVM